MFFSKTYPSFLTVKEGSTFLTKPLFPQGREDVTALRCSEPLRYKVGGPIKGLARLCGMGPPCYKDSHYYVLITSFILSSNHVFKKNHSSYIICLQILVFFCSCFKVLISSLSFNSKSRCTFLRINAVCLRYAKEKRRARNTK